MLSRSNPGKVVVDLGVNNPLRTERIAREADKRGVSYLDAPISQTVGGNEECGVSVMVGGSFAAYGKIKPVLEKIGNQVIYVGTSGMGHKAKVISSIISMANQAILCEAMVLGVKAGMKPEQIMDVINSGAAESFVSRWEGERNFKGNRRESEEDRMKIANPLWEIAREMGRQAKVSLPVMGMVSQVYVAASTLSLAALEICSVIKPYEMMAGTIIETEK